MLPTAKGLFGVGALLGLLVLLLLLTGGASATPDSNNDLGDAVEVRNWDRVTGDLSEVDDGSDFYKIFMRPGEFLDIILDMEAGANYSSHVRAVNMLGEGEASASISVDVPGEGEKGTGMMLLVAVIAIALIVAAAAVLVLRRR